MQVRQTKSYYQITLCVYTVQTSTSSLVDLFEDTSFKIAVLQEAILAREIEGFPGGCQFSHITQVYLGTFTWLSD